MLQAQFRRYTGVSVRDAPPEDAPAIAAVAPTPGHAGSRPVTAERFLPRECQSSTMAGQLRTPDRRTCERCDRVERWDEETFRWRATEAGMVNCIHEWDIDGTFVSIVDDG